MWLVVFGLAFGHRAEAAEASGDLDRWVPSFSFFFDVTRQKAEGSVSTGLLQGPPLPPYGNGCTGSGLALCPSKRLEYALVDHSDEGSDTGVATMVGASLELMTPRLLHVLTDPRLFVHGDASLAFGFERNLAGRGSPGERSVPPYPQQVTDIEELSIPGQGSRTRWQLGDYVYSAGGGVAFSFTLFQRTFRLKPSFEWVQLEQDFIGVTRREVKQFQPTGITSLDAFRPISLTKVKTRTFDAIGPGLEIEADTARLGPIQTSLYVSGRFYHFLNSLDTSLEATNEFGETATWGFNPERWMYRVGVGFRLRWAPEAD